MMIRNNKTIKGIALGDSEVKISQFADDTTCVVRSSESAAEVMKTLQLFAKFSGLHINVEKSMVMPLGRVPQRHTSIGGLPMAHKVKILGVWFANARSEKEHYEWNFSPLITKMKNTCKSWDNRMLSLKGRVVVFNTLVISLLQYLIANTHTPRWVAPETRKIACEFIWAGRRNKVAYNTLIQSISEGGLKLMSIEARITTSLLSWVRRTILFPESTASNIIRIYCGEANPILVWAAKRNFSGCLSQVSPFYTEVLRVWHKLHNTLPLGEEEIRKEVLWNNPNIPSLSEHRSRPRWHRWIEAGILTVEQLCHQTEARLMGQQELDDTYSIQPTFLEALAIRNYIPWTWRKALTANFKNTRDISYEMNINGQLFDIMNSSPKKWYEAIILGMRQVIKRQHSWDQEVAILGDKNPIDWDAIYRLPYITTRETKLQSFHYRVVHRLITCNRYLRTIQLHPTGICEGCGTEDTICHFFVLCPLVNTFWANLNKWCENQLDLSIASLSTKEKVLGLVNDNGNTSQNKLLNWLLLVAKYFLHRQKLFHKGDISLIAFLSELKTKINTEKQACFREGKPRKFRVWERMFKVLNP